MVDRVSRMRDSDNQLSLAARTIAARLSGDLPASDQFWRKLVTLNPQWAANPRAVLDRYALGPEITPRLAAVLVPLEHDQP